MLKEARAKQLVKKNDKKANVSMGPMKKFSSKSQLSEEWFIEVMIDIGELKTMRSLFKDKLQNLIYNQMRRTLLTIESKLKILNEIFSNE